MNIRHWFYLHSLRKKNGNQNPSIISNNCIGGVIYHNLGLQFLSPTINLFINSDDFVFFCKHIEYYSTCPLIQDFSTDKNYPVGRIIPDKDGYKEITVNFQHYKSFEEAEKKWVERFKRINWNNMYFIFEFYNSIYNPELMDEFDNAELRGKKILLLHEEVKHIKNQFVLSCYKNDMPIGKVLEFDKTTGNQYLEEFDYVSFLN